MSPVLWRRLVRAKSAGRVQSAALRLVVDREVEIETHAAKPHWVVNAKLAHVDGTVFSAVLTAMQGSSTAGKHRGEASANEAAARLLDSTLQVVNIAAKEKSRFSPAPFTTSTMQQEASRRLGMSPAVTMQVAQSLYEGDLQHGGLLNAR